MEPKVNQQPKHISLHMQLERYDDVLKRLEDLVREIKGDVIPDEDVKVPAEKRSTSTPSLLELLDGAPEWMAKQNTKFSDLIEELRRLLFY